MRPGLTHQSVGLTLTNDSNVEDTWDLSDSLADLFKEVNRRDRDASSQSRPGGGGGGAKTQQGQSRMGDDAWKHVDVSRWIGDDTSHGFIRVSSSENDDNSRLFPCTLSTTAQKICVQLGIPHNALHVQLNGDIIRRMEPFDCPLAVQNEYLSSIGFTDIRRIQEEGAKEELSYLVKFYSGEFAVKEKKLGYVQSIRCCVWGSGCNVQTVQLLWFRFLPRLLQPWHNPLWLTGLRAPTN